MLCDDDSQTFETPPKNHSVTTSSAQVLLGTDSLQYKHNNITHSPGQKLPPPGKYYLCFQIGGKIAHAVQCAKSRSLNKVIDSII